jgi:hypothetical protein
MKQIEPTVDKSPNPLAVTVGRQFLTTLLPV